MSSETEGWVICAWCNEEWPADAFKGSGTATRRTLFKVCSACFVERYPRRRTRCCACQAPMTTRGANDFPTCRKCRASSREAWEQARKQLVKAPRFCKLCGIGLGAPDGCGLRCRPCRSEVERLRAAEQRRRGRKKWTETDRNRRRDSKRKRAA